MMLQRLIIIIITMCNIPMTFACLTSGTCDCGTNVGTSCSCSQPQITRSAYIAPPPLPAKNLPNIYVQPPQSYPSPYSVQHYRPINSLPVSYSQRYSGLSYTYNPPQSYPQQPLVSPALRVPPPSLPYNAPRTIGGNIMGSSGIYNPPRDIYEVHSRETLPKMKVERPTAFDQFTYPRTVIQQIQVSPSLVSRENPSQSSTNGDLQFKNDFLLPELPAQSIANIPDRYSKKLRNTKELNSYHDEITTTEIYQNFINANEKRILPHTFAIQHRLSGRQNTAQPKGDSKRRDRWNLSCISKTGSNVSKITGTGGGCIVNGHERSNIEQQDSQAELSQKENLKSFDALISDQQTTLNALRENFDKIITHNNSGTLQISQNSSNAENASRKQIDRNSTGNHKVFVQNLKIENGKTTFKKVLIGSWTGGNQRLFKQTNKLDNKEIQNENDDGHYNTYYHQTCTGWVLGRLRNETVTSAVRRCDQLKCEAANVRLSRNRILEITFLKNVTGRFKNYGTYCVAKNPISGIKFSRILVKTNGLSYSRRLHDDPSRSGIHYRKRWGPLRGAEQRIRPVRHDSESAISPHFFISSNKTHGYVNVIGNDDSLDDNSDNDNDSLLRNDNEDNEESD
uniref:Uncharacterized protein n=1 Tax=Setaria digitata TaxID=48799 RepID=A0A915Q490_9BILA